MRAQYYRQEQRYTNTPSAPTTTSKVLRRISFLPPPSIKTPQEQYTGITHLENYIDDTKQLVADNLPIICEHTTTNLSPQQQRALMKLKNLRKTITVKPADKNLGVVIMDTDDYIKQCMQHLTDTTTYRLTTEYPTTDIQRQISNIICSFKHVLEHFNKRLYKLLCNNQTIPAPHNSTDYIPKIHHALTTTTTNRSTISINPNTHSKIDRPHSTTPSPTISGLPTQLHFPLSPSTRSTRTRRRHISNHRRGQLVSIHPAN